MTGTTVMQIVQETLRPFGITRCYVGYKQICYSISLAVVDESRLEAVVKEIYMETADHFGCSWKDVERNLRTACARAWEVNAAHLIQMAGYPLTATPTSHTFIEIIASYIIRNFSVRTVVLTQPLFC